VANQLYGLARQAWALGQVNWNSNAIHGVFVDLADYTVSITGDEFLSDIPVSARVATFGPLTGKSALLGALDADDVTVNDVTGDQFEAVVLNVSTGNDATSRLLIFLDTADGLPVTPVGGPVDIRWDDGPNKIATL
jgi:hypothetical protein